MPDTNRVFETYQGLSVNGTSSRNTEILTLRSGPIIEVEVYFGWSIPHPARAGSFVDEDEKDRSVTAQAAER